MHPIQGHQLMARRDARRRCQRWRRSGRRCWLDQLLRGRLRLHLHLTDGWLWRRLLLLLQEGRQPAL
jgi:hypothetical protein